MTVPIAFGFYLLLAGAVGAEQLVSAAAMTLVAVAWSTLLRRAGNGRRFAFDRTHAAPWLRSIARMPGDTLRIGAILTRTILTGESPGHARRPAFRFGPVDAPADAARRATAVVAGSLTPDAIVVDVAPGRSTALVHSFSPPPSRSPERSEWLV